MTVVGQSEGNARLPYGRRLTQSRWLDVGGGVSPAAVNRPPDRLPQDLCSRAGGLTHSCSGRSARKLVKLHHSDAPRSQRIANPAIEDHIRSSKLYTDCFDRDKSLPGFGTTRASPMAGSSSSAAEISACSGSVLKFHR